MEGYNICGLDNGDFTKGGQGKEGSWEPHRIGGVFGMI